MFCTKCGAVLGNGKFCTSCGAPVETAEAAPVEESVCEAAVEVNAEAEETQAEVICEDEILTAVEETPAESENTEAEVLIDDVCTSCGAPLSGRAFCVNCGAPKGGNTPVAEPVQETEDTCTSCGSPLDGKAFCIVCGTPKGGKAPVAEPVPTPADNCANCGSPLNGKSFCIVCGTPKGGKAPTAEPVPAPADNCANCGSPLDGKAFCIVCGTPKGGKAPAAEPVPAPADNCANCGSPLNGKAFCIVCGTSKNGNAAVQQPQQPVYQPAPAPKPAPIQAGPLKEAFGSVKFLVITILVSLFTLLTIINGSAGFDVGDIPVQAGKIMSLSVISSAILPILISIGLWITYVTAKGNGKISSAGVSICSGVMLVNYIISWIPVVLLAVAGLICFIPGLAMLVTGRYEMFNGFITTDYGSGGALGALFIGLGILVGAGIGLIFVLLFYRRLWKFVKSVAISIKTENVEYKFAKASKGWLMFFGIVSVISAVVLIIAGLGAFSTSLLFTGVANAFAAVATICGSSWIKKNCL